MMVQTDTGSSVQRRRGDPASLDDADHPALLMVDGIAPIGCEHFEMDALGVDVALAASQKGLMTPPGLGLVWAGPRALAAHRDADMRIQYWDWTTRRDDGPMYLKFCGTPPVSLLYGLREALAMIDEEGLDAVWTRHQVLADAACRGAWSTPNGIGFHGARRRAGNSVTTVESRTIDASRCRRSAATNSASRSASVSATSTGAVSGHRHMGHQPIDSARGDRRDRSRTRRAGRRSVDPASPLRQR